MVKCYSFEKGYDEVLKIILKSTRDINRAASLLDKLFLTGKLSVNGKIIVFNYVTMTICVRDAAKKLF